MVEPVTTNRSLVVPNTGDLSAAWGTAALNPNFTMLDTMFGGVTTITLSVATTITLTVPPPNGNWTSGTIASQSANSVIRFTGAQSASATINFTLPGFYIIENKCTGTTSVRLSNVAGTGNKIGAPPGKKCHVFFDGTDMDYVNMPDPSTAYDMHTNTTTLPPWMTACTVSPYLIKDGTSYSVATYPALAQMLGSTYGGDGTISFFVPDERARARLPVDTVKPASGATSARVTFAVAGFTGSLLGAAGGDQRLHIHSHTNTLTDPGHTHTVTNAIPAINFEYASGGSQGGQASVVTSSTSTSHLTLNNVATGAGASQNMMPAIVSFLPLIKT